MTAFEGGPAAGQKLWLRRSPLLLRVVLNRFAEKPAFDALDLLTDRPEPNELVYAYRLVKRDGHMHICARGKGARSGFMEIATYAYLDEQPPADVLRNNAKWAAWATAEAEKLKGANP